MLNYKIQVYMTPSTDPKDKHAPYFWCIQSCDFSNPDSNWCMEQAGWEKTAEDAWKQAQYFYDKYKME